MGHLFSFESLLHDLGHVCVHDEDLVKQHLDDLALVLFVVSSDLGQLVLHLVVHSDDFLVLALSL